MRNVNGCIQKNLYSDSSYQYQISYHNNNMATTTANKRVGITMPTMVRCALLFCFFCMKVYDMMRARYSLPTISMVVSPATTDHLRQGRYTWRLYSQSKSMA